MKTNTNEPQQPDSFGAVLGMVSPNLQKKTFNVRCSRMLAACNRGFRSYKGIAD